MYDRNGAYCRDCQFVHVCKSIRFFNQHTIIFNFQMLLFYQSIQTPKISGTSPLEFFWELFFESYRKITYVSFMVPAGA